MRTEIEIKNRITKMLTSHNSKIEYVFTDIARWCEVWLSENDVIYNQTHFNPINNIEQLKMIISANYTQFLLWIDTDNDFMKTYCIANILEASRKANELYSIG